jgi:hypothetical protein
MLIAGKQPEYLPDVKICSHFRRIRTRAANERPQASVIYGVSFMEVDRPNCLAVQTCVEELPWILHPSSVGECQPHGVLEGFSDANDSIMRPDRDSMGLEGFFHFTSSTAAGSAFLMRARS